MHVSRELLSGPYVTLVTLVNWTRTFDRYVARFKVKNGHQDENMCHDGYVYKPLTECMCTSIVILIVPVSEDGLISVFGKLVKVILNCFVL